MPRPRTEDPSMMDATPPRGSAGSFPDPDSLRTQQRGAWDDFVRTYGGLVLKMCYQQGGGLDDTPEDLAQTIMLELYHKGWPPSTARLESKRDFELYLKRTIHHKIIDQRRRPSISKLKRALVQWLPRAVRSWSAPPNQRSVAARQEIEEIFEHVLTDLERDVLFFRDFEGYTRKETAQIMDRTPDAVAAARKRARAKLARYAEQAPSIAIAGGHE